jgi:hypothetical protein
MLEADAMFFDRPGKANTEQTLKLAAARARELGIRELVVATSSGRTALQALEIAPDLGVVAVGYHYGYKKPFQSGLSPEARRELSARCAALVCATHALSGIERAVAAKHGGVYPVLLMADTLRLFGQGTKVAVEITVMAADAGALSGADIVAVGGTSQGADAALVLKPAHMNNFFDLRIREVICKPRDF